MKRFAAGVALLAISLCSPVYAQATKPEAAEARVIDYIRDHLHPGQPLLVTELYSKVFTQPDERQALNKLYGAFFRVPLFVAQYQEKFGRPPTLKEINEQFDLKEPEAADVILRVMESDPRVPKFLERDPKSGEITRVGVAKIKNDEKFGEAYTRQIAGWEGKLLPDFTLQRLGGGQFVSAELKGHVGLVYVWFTGCPPCMQEAPALAQLFRDLSSRGLVIVGANADQLLGLDYDDSVRSKFMQEQKITYPIVQWSKAADAAFGGISIYPTIFLTDRHGVVTNHWIGYVAPRSLRAAIQENLDHP
jgi:thiol-disulfide isomerase/thioredoxin